MKLWNRIRYLLCREEFDRELQEEMHIHREMAEEKLSQSGSPQEEARYGAMTIFGNNTLALEDSRAVWSPFLETLFQDLRFGLRMLRKSPGFTAVALLTIALGIGVNTAVFSVVNAALVKSLPYPKADRLVHLWETYQGHAIASQREASWPNYQDWVQRYHAFDAMAGYWFMPFSVAESGQPAIMPGGGVTSSFFTVLGVQPSLGRAFAPGDEQPGAGHVTILSNGLWQRRFGGDANVIGRSIDLSGVNYTVIGVLPKDFQFAPLGVLDIWVPLVPAGNQATKRYFHWLHVIARLKDGVTLDQARAEMTVVSAQLAAQYPDTNTGTGIRVITLREQITGQIRPVLFALFGTAGLVLLIACANLANLYLARAASRQREVGLRIALGATRSRILQQIFCECGLLSLAGGALGLLAAKPGVKLALRAIPAGILQSSLPYLKNASMDWSVFAFALGIAVFTTLAFGLLPALRASSTDVQDALKDGGRTSQGGVRQRTRDALVVCEVALSLTLLVGAGILLHSLTRLLNVDPGFDPHNLLTAQVSLPRTQFPGATEINALQQRLFARLAQIPGVTTVGSIDTPPMMGGGTISVSVEGRPVPRLEDAQDVNTRQVSVDYFRAMKIPLVRGRFFTAQDDVTHPHAVIINYTLANLLFHTDNPVGHRLLLSASENQPAIEIVGVAGDEKLGPLDQPTTPIVYDPLLQDASRTVSLVIRTAVNPNSEIAPLREAIRELNPQIVVTRFATIDDIISASPATFLRRFPALLIGSFAALALLLAAIGVYGVVAYFVAQRTREIGIRMALGAAPSDIVMQVVARGLRIAVTGIALGTLLSLALTRLLASLLFRVAPFDPVTFAGVAALLTVIAALACYLPTRNAAHVDPMACLRVD
jgi:putative ABC transport system permease protein